MAIFAKGSTGTEVQQIQEALRLSGLLKGPADGIYGGSTCNAVMQYQQRCGIEVDGIVGPTTWQNLFAQTKSQPAIACEDVETRCLALTGSFETGKHSPHCFAAITGNFDGQGMSFGALQWNFGQGTLQPLLKKMLDDHGEVVADIFDTASLAMVRQACDSIEAGLTFAESVQEKERHHILPHWQEMFTTLGLTREFQTIQRDGATQYATHGLNLCREYSLWSQRGRALMFDICVQNGSIPKQVKTRIMQDFTTISPDISPEEMELAKMRSIANRRAEAANPRFVEDVRQRKLCIAEGKGTVHGIAYDLATQFGLNLLPADENGKP